MSMKSKQKKKEARAAAKKARKTANYLRNGPKQGYTSRRQQKRNKAKFRPGVPKLTSFKPKRGKTARRRSQGLSTKGPNCKGPKRRPNYPLTPLRKRRHLSSGDIGIRRSTVIRKRTAYMYKGVELCELFNSGETTQEEFVKEVIRLEKKYNRQGDKK